MLKLCLLRFSFLSWPQLSTLPISFFPTRLAKRSIRKETLNGARRVRTQYLNNGVKKHTPHLALAYYRRLRLYLFCFIYRLCLQIEGQNSFFRLRIYTPRSRRTLSLSFLINMSQVLSLSISFSLFIYIFPFSQLVFNAIIPNPSSS